MGVSVGPLGTLTVTVSFAITPERSVRVAARLATVVSTGTRAANWPAPITPGTPLTDTPNAPRAGTFTSPRTRTGAVVISVPDGGDVIRMDGTESTLRLTSTVTTLPLWTGMPLRVSDR